MVRSGCTRTYPPPGREIWVLRTPREGRLSRPELPRNARDHHPRTEEQPRLQPERALVVQQVFPPAPHDVLRDEDAGDVARALGPDPADVVEHRPGDVAVRRVED